MKLKSIVLGILMSLIFLAIGCHNAVTTVNDLEEQDQSSLELNEVELPQFSDQDFNLTQSEIELLKSEGEDVDAFLNRSREYLESGTSLSAFGIINSYFKSHYKEKWTTKNGKQICTAYIAMTGEGGSDNEDKKRDGYVVAPHYSTSEAMSYGMRLAIYGYKGFPKVTSQGMGIAKDKFRKRFDRLWETQHRYPSKASKWGGQLMGLHSWIIPKSGYKADADTAASDGDLDIAYALLEADKLWGSNGDINYKTEAFHTISAIANNLTNTATVNGKEITFLKVGDWAVPCTETLSEEDKKDLKKVHALMVKKRNAYVKMMHSRPCDWMLHHFRTFIRFLKDAGFDDNNATIITYKKLIDSTEYLLSLNKWKTGLMPDFVYFRDNGMFLPSETFLTAMGEDTKGKMYSWNACRIPWRLAMDVAQNKPMPSRIALSNIYYTTKWGNSIKDIGTDYTLAGQITNSAFESAFSAPIVASLVGRMTFIRSSGEYRFFSYKKAKAMAELSTQFSGCQEWGYFGDSILAFSMVVLENKPGVISSPY